jgi:hypothetical protein
MFVEHQTPDGSWSLVEKWSILVQRQARKLYGAGPLTDSRLRGGEAAMLLESESLDPFRRYAQNHWFLARDYTLFGLLSGAREELEPVYPARGFPGDLSDLGRAQLPLGLLAWDAYGTWLTTTELQEVDKVYRAATSFSPRQSTALCVDVIHPMLWAGPPYRVRAVMWFS